MFENSAGYSVQATRAP